MGQESELLELMKSYAIKGVEDWCSTYRESKRNDTARCLGAPIAQSTHDAVAATLKQSATNGLVEFIPMPTLTDSAIEWAFFSPRRESDDSDDGWVFDLFLLLPGGKHIGFRLEPADRYPNARHGYSHVQLCWRFGHKAVQPASPLHWLPDSYPAFPLPGRESLDRFLILVVSMHGFPGGTPELLRDLQPGRPALAQQYAERLAGLLGDG